MKTAVSRYIRIWARSLRWPRRRTVEVTAICRAAARGNIEARIKDINPRAQFGQLCLAINAVLDMTDAFLREAAAAMDHCSHDRFHRPILLRGLHGSYQQSAVTINRAAARMKVQSEDLAFIADRADDTAGQVHNVAAACEELNATTHEISNQTTSAADHARRVADQLRTMNASFAKLETTIKKIDGIVEILNSVSLQTQLLGLNASIEAAHAHEHGESFAVVAAEIKKLSDDTHRAAEEIGREIAAIQSASTGAAVAVRDVSKEMTEFENVAVRIETSVREQVRATGSISQSITTVSAMSSDISDRISNTKGSTPAQEMESPSEAAQPAA